MRFMHYSAIFAVFTFAMLASSSAHAVDVDTIMENIRGSSSSLSGLAAAFAYLTGTLLAVLGVLKTIDHVSNPSQTPIRAPVVRFLVGGGMFALPIVIEAAYRTFNGAGAAPAFSSVDGGAMIGALNLKAAEASTASAFMNFNVILYWITESVELIPGFIAMLAYMLAILLVISGLLKIRDHVDEPERTGVREPVIRLLIAGALLALPTIYQALYTTIAGDGLDGSTGGTALFILMLGSTLTSSVVPGADTCYSSIASVVLGPSLGRSICHLQGSTMVFPAFLAGLSYVLGLIFGLWGLFKVRDHVLEPTKTPLSEGVTRLLAGGAFFAMPFISFALSSSLLMLQMHPFHEASGTTNFNETVSTADCTITATLGGANSLDEAFGCLMLDTFGPLHLLLNLFCIVAGMIFVMIGISRIIRSSQEGARGPGGRGTVATFVAAAALLSANPLMRAISGSMFLPTGSIITSPGAINTTNANLQFTSGMNPLEIEATHNVISAVLKFMIIIGLISFVRGIFIMRDVAEGNQQASTMSGVTHILGGALAVNLGPLLNAIQATLGITAFGVSFT